jgi:hypothetical protein
VLNILLFTLRHGILNETQSGEASSLDAAVTKIEKIKSD